MIHESDRNTPLLGVREPYAWAQDLPLQQKACFAIRQRDTALLAQALLDGAQINCSRRPLLVEAASRGHDEIAGYLLTKGADVAAANPWGETPMHAAAQGGHYWLLGDLIDAGGDVNARDVSQTTPLMLAVFHGHFDCVELLADSGADVSALDRDGVSVLAQVRNGRAAVLWKRRRALRHLRDRIEHGHVDREEIDQSIEQDFEWLRSVEERYQEIRAYLSALGAKDCGTPVDLLTFPVTIRAVGPVSSLTPKSKK